MEADSSKVVEYFQAIYSLKNYVWGEEPSTLAKEAAAILKANNQNQRLRVLDLGCGDGKDALFFAQQGWLVTAVDICPGALDTLRRDAKELGVQDRVVIINTDISQFSSGDTFDLIYSDSTLHYLNQSQRHELLRRIPQWLNPGAYFVASSFTDMNDHVVGDVEKYCYLQRGELHELLPSLSVIDSYEGNIPDQHPGYEPHEHCISTIISQKPKVALNNTSKKSAKRFKVFPLFMGAILISVVLCTLGYSSLKSAGGTIANVWPGAIFQAVSAISLGGWGVLSTVIAGALTNAINGKGLIAVIALTPANLIQSLIPAYYYRHKLRSGGWNSKVFNFIPFLIYAVLIPNLLGGMFGALAVHLLMDVPFWAMYFKWISANVPIAILLGWPLFKLLVPCLVEEGWVVRGWWR